MVTFAIAGINYAQLLPDLGYEMNIHSYNTPVNKFFLKPLKIYESYETFKKGFVDFID